MTDWPILSTVTFLPLVGVFFILLIRGDERQIAANSRHVALWTSWSRSHSRSCWWRTSTPRPLSSSSSSSCRGCPSTTSATTWRGRDLDLLPGPDHLPDPDLHPRLVGGDRDSRARIHDRLPGDGDADRRCLLLPRLRDVLHLLRGAADPDVPDHRHLGGARRVYSAFKFFLYTLVGSVLFLLAILFMYLDAGTTDIPMLLVHEFAPAIQTWLWLALSPPSPSSCRCGPSTPGCRTPTWRRRRRAR